MEPTSGSQWRHTVTRTRGSVTSRNQATSPWSRSSQTGCFYVSVSISCELVQNIFPLFLRAFCIFDFVCWWHFLSLFEISFSARKPADCAESNKDCANFRFSLLLRGSVWSLNDLLRLCVFFRSKVSVCSSTITMATESGDHGRIILVTGGAGYVGSHCILELLNAGFDVVAVDNFVNAIAGDWFRRWIDWLIGFVRLIFWSIDWLFDWFGLLLIFWNYFRPIRKASGKFETRGRTDEQEDHILHRRCDGSRPVEETISKGLFVRSKKVLSRYVIWKVFGFWIILFYSEENLKDQRSLGRLNNRTYQLFKEQPFDWLIDWLVYWFIHAPVSLVDPRCILHCFASWFQHSYFCIIHCAALKAVGESVKHPLEYYRNNVAGTVNLLQVLTRAVGTRAFYCHVERRHSRRSIDG